MGVSPFNLILFVSICVDKRLLCIVVFDISNKQSTRDRLPECLSPNIITGVF